MTDVRLCLVQKPGSLYKSKAKRNVHYIPIVTHISINLAVGDTMKVCPVLKDAIDNIYELFKLVKMSYKRDAKRHGSGEDFNFTQLYILREEDEVLKAWRTDKKNQ